MMGFGAADGGERVAQRVSHAAYACLKPLGVAPLEAGNSDTVKSFKGNHYPPLLLARRRWSLEPLLRPAFPRRAGFWCLPTRSRNHLVGCLKKGDDLEQ